MPRTVKYNRAKNTPSQTLLEYLASSFTYLTESEWTWHICEGHISVNSTKEYNPHRILLQRDEITFAPPRSMEPEVDDIHITILYIDDFLIVCSKNGNLPVSEGGRYCENTLVGVLIRCGLRKFCFSFTINKETTLCENVEEEELARKKRAIEVEQGDQQCISACKPVPLRTINCINRNTCVKKQNESGNTAASSELELFVVHRLDKETSGLVIIARSAHVAHMLALQFSEPSSEHNSVCVKRKSVQCKEEDMMSANESNSEQSYWAQTNTTESDDANLESHNDKNTKLNKRVVKRYIAVLVGCAEVGRTYSVNVPIGCIANDSTMRNKAEHHKLKKLKMMCYITDKTNQVFNQCMTEECTKKNNNELSNCQGKNEYRDLSIKQNVKCSKVAKSSIYILANDKELNLSIAQITIFTGRTHQIRLHCAHIGFPVFGDKLYYSQELGKEGNSFAVDDDVYLARVRATNLESYMTDKHVTDIKVRRHLLHAAYISFTHPVHDVLVEFNDNPLQSFKRDVLIKHKYVEERFVKLVNSSLTAN